jgi:hypothetical protein
MAMTTKFMFDWCKRCAFLQGCYYQHGEKSATPMFLEPACGNGPATEEAAGAPISHAGIRKPTQAELDELTS